MGNCHSTCCTACDRATELPALVPVPHGGKPSQATKATGKLPEQNAQLPVYPSGTVVRSSISVSHLIVTPSPVPTATPEAASEPSPTPNPADTSTTAVQSSSSAVCGSFPLPSPTSSERENLPATPRSFLSTSGRRLGKDSERDIHKDSDSDGSESLVIDCTKNHQSQPQPPTKQSSGENVSSSGETVFSSACSRHSSPAQAPLNHNMSHPLHRGKVTWRGNLKLR